jgi:hypothetical protein
MEAIFAYFELIWVIFIDLKCRSLSLLTWKYLTLKYIYKKNMKRSMNLEACCFITVLNSPLISYNTGTRKHQSLIKSEDKNWKVWFILLLGHFFTYRLIILEKLSELMVWNFVHKFSV